jgi:hypothetical protein
MNRIRAQKTTPVIMKVMIKVVSIVPQLDASGVNHHGLTRLKTTDPTTSKANTIATVIARSPRFFFFEKTDSGVGPVGLLDSAIFGFHNNGFYSLLQGSGKLPFPNRALHLLTLGLICN